VTRDDSGSVINTERGKSRTLDMHKPIPQYNNNNDN